MTRRAARFVAAVTSRGLATPAQARRALKITHAVGLSMRAQLARVRTPAARQRIMVAGNRRLTAQICAPMGEEAAIRPSGHRVTPKRRPNSAR